MTAWWWQRSPAVTASRCVAGVWCVGEWGQGVHGGVAAAAGLVECMHTWPLACHAQPDPSQAPHTRSNIVTRPVKPLQANTEEQERLRSAGAQLAPLGCHLQGPAKPREMGVGPLRLWPGGCVEGGRRYARGGGGVCVAAGGSRTGVGQVRGANELGWQCLQSHILLEHHHGAQPYAPGTLNQL